MSFHKRSFNKDLIIQFSKLNTYEDFNRWIIKPDSRISSDYFSLGFISSYFLLSPDERSFLYLSARNNEDFCADLVKCIRVCRNRNNLKKHNKAIKKYIDLFSIKWPTEYPFYEKIINK